MFSKLMAFGAMALALVNPAPNSPSQNPLSTVSCNMNPNANVAPVLNQVQSTGKIESGLYRIFNSALKLDGSQRYSALRSEGANKPIVVFRGESSAPYTVWRVEAIGHKGHVAIFDNDLDLPLGLLADWTAPVSDSFPQVFYLQPNTTSSENKFGIYTSEGNVWTLWSQYPDYRRFYVYLSGSPHEDTFPELDL
ncbi:hypothetical protein B0H19DRAFT_1266622 [Mycena capillaripes]|nr:hypothetical protein B0H19DRAFT_1266622 [Mycena capillaripes]